MTTDRVFFASGVLLVAAFAVVVERLFADRDVRRLVVGACVVLAAYHAVRFIDTSVRFEVENSQRLALLRDARPGTQLVVPAYEHRARSRWYLGDDFVMYPWLRDYVGSSLFDLAVLDLDRPRPAIARYVASGPAVYVPTYREQLLNPALRPLAGDLTIRVTGLWFDDPRRRPVFARAPGTFVEGRPHDERRGHFIRVVRATLPPRAGELFVFGCGRTNRVEPIADGDALLLAVDERDCRGPFTALACEPDRCWLAGWY